MGCADGCFEAPLSYDVHVGEKMDFIPENLDDGDSRKVERDCKVGQMAEILPNMLFFSSVEGELQNDQDSPSLI